MADAICFVEEINSGHHNDLEEAQHVALPIPFFLQVACWSILRICSETRLSFLTHIAALLSVWPSKEKLVLETGGVSSPLTSSLFFGARGLEIPNDNFSG